MVMILVALVMVIDDNGGMMMVPSFPWLVCMHNIHLPLLGNGNSSYMIRVAQSALKSKNLSGHQFYSCFLPKRWGKCIEIPKKLMARVCTLLPHLGPHLPYGYQGKNAIFWSRSILTPLIALKTPTNIGKQLCISQCPTRDPKSTKIEHLDQIFHTVKWPW